MISARFETEYAPIGVSLQTPASEATSTIEPPRRAQRREQRAGVAERRDEIRRDDGVPLLVRGLRERGLAQHAGVEDGDVEPAEPRDRLLDRGGDRCRRRRASARTNWRARGGRTRAPRAASRPVNTTRAPSAASRVTTASPIPEVPPVTNAR